VLRIGVPSSSHLVLWSLSPTGRHPRACFERLSENNEQGRPGPGDEHGFASCSCWGRSGGVSSPSVPFLGQRFRDAVGGGASRGGHGGRLGRIFILSPTRASVRIHIQEHRPQDNASRCSTDPVRDWLRLMRVAHAVDVFTSRDVQIQEAATLAGFNSVRSFERAFRVIVGTSPRQFKNRVMHPANHTMCRV
jgi:AraC-like DNA-binding protein